MPRYNHATVLHGTRCTIEMRGGRFCDAERASDMPVPICALHAIEIYKHMDALLAEVQTNYRDHLDVHNAMVNEVAAQGYAAKNSRDHRIYYLRVGQLIKIGTTANLRRRIAQYPPDAELLAVERGGEAVESRRHQKFGHLLAGRKEWFHPGPDLMDYIEKVASKNPGPLVAAQ